MNYTNYIFGMLSSGYTKYPDNGSSQVLSKLYPLCKAPTQIIVHREDNLMYYCYIRKLSGSKYIGMAVVINGYYITTLSNVFKTFENAVEEMVNQGELIHLDQNGDIIPSTGELRDKGAEIDRIRTSLKLQVESDWVANALPPINYAVSKDSKKDFASTDNSQDIICATYTYGYTIIYKEKDYDTIHMTNYRAVLSKLKQDNDSLIDENAKLKKNNAQLSKLKQDNDWLRNENAKLKNGALVKSLKRQRMWLLLLILGVWLCSIENEALINIGIILCFVSVCGFINNRFE